ncbi:MAG: PAS domain S-box protein [Acidobacteria bacterium]|nr:MAG: PAS domain S-box protein [Acidobacteriota bacterium]
MSRELRLLILEDDPHDAELAVAHLEKAGYSCQWEQVETRQEFLARLEAATYDLILADYNLPSFDGLTALKLFRQRDPDTPFILISGTLGEERAIESLKAGATDYVLKDRLSRLEPIVARALEEARERRRRRRAEEELRRATNMLNSILTSATEYAIVATDLDFRIIHYNPAAERLFGYTAQEVIGRKIPDVHLRKETQRERFARAIQVVEREGRWEHDLEWKDPQGSPRIIHMVVMPMRDEMGASVGYILFAQDVTERRRIERMFSQLQEQTSQLVGELRTEQLYQDVLRAAHLIVPADAAILSLLDEEGAELQYLAAEGERAEILLPRARPLASLGLAPLAVRERTLVQSDDLMNDSRVSREYAEHVNMRVEMAIPLIKGERVLGALMVLRRDEPFDENERRALTIFANTAAGLIDSARLYERARQAERRYRDLYENAPDGYYTVDAQGVVKEMNATMLKWLGYHHEELLGRRRFEELLAPESRERYRRLVERCRGHGVLENVELELVSREGRRFPVRINATAVWREGNYAGCRATVRDITRERELEAQLLQAQKLESLGTLVGGIAHDFNNMLTGILGFTQLLMRQVEPQSPIYEGLGRIEVLGERAADMIRQLLAFSRQDVGEKRRLMLRPFLKEVGKLLERVIPENIELLLNLSPEELWVEADPTQLQQVIMNLVVNARDAMPEGGRLQIAMAPVNLDEAFCRAHPDLQPGRYVRLGVSDTGVGIPEEIRSRIFDPFFTTKEVGKGTGLGLPVVYGIVKNHGGAIEVQSEVGKGTTVHIWLPLAERGAVGEETARTEAPGGTETILLVEDEPSVLELGKMALEHLGYRVLTAENGLEALTIYMAHRDEIALVILDMVMPRLGGPETFRELKRINPSTRVLLATGYDTTQTAAQALLDEGASGLMRKPYQIHELAQAVRAALESSKL